MTTEGWDGKERRRHPRVEVGGAVQSRIYTVAAAPVINLSQTGALLELPCALAPNSVYTVRFPDGERTIELRGRIVRSYVHGFGRNEKGETVITYRAAVHFVDVDEATRGALTELLGRFASGGAVRAGVEKEPPPAGGR